MFMNFFGEKPAPANHGNTINHAEIFIRSHQHGLEGMVRAPNFFSFQESRENRFDARNICKEGKGIST